MDPIEQCELLFQPFIEFSCLISFCNWRSVSSSPLDTHLIWTILRASVFHAHWFPLEQFQYINLACPFWFVCSTQFLCPTIYKWRSISSDTLHLSGNSYESLARVICPNFTVLLYSHRRVQGVWDKRQWGREVDHTHNQKVNMMLNLVEPNWTHI